MKIPTLYLLRYIIKNKILYYKALQGVTEKNDRTAWILYMLDAVEKTAQETLTSIKDIYSAQNELLNFLSRKAPSLCSKELVELLFEQPYCKISYVI